jgi:hypothetical protein
MSALTAAANDEDGETIDQLRAENTKLRQALLALHDTLEMTARAGAHHARALAELEAQMEAVGAGGVGPLVTRGQDEPVAWECKAGGLKRLSQRQYERQPEKIKRHYTRIQPDAQQAAPEATTRVIDAARRLLTFIEIKHRPPVRDQIEAGRMVHVRLHALADLHDAIMALGAKA